MPRLLRLLSGNGVPKHVLVSKYVSRNENKTYPASQNYPKIIDYKSRVKIRIAKVTYPSSNEIEGR